jgi:glutamate-1-semialdehyde aminotransferase/spore coat polysaccharide biosynthesis protein SpsF (cytidylyltransferase family)
MAQKVVAILQARMGSSRFPGKVLKTLSGRPMLWHSVERIKRAKEVHEVVIATSFESDDDAIADFANSYGYKVFRGSHDDVLGRFVQCAQQFQADVVVRLTGDCPFLDPAVIDQVVLAHRVHHADYASNTIESTFPDGLDVEVLSAQSLYTAGQLAQSHHEREHVTPFIRHDSRFKRHSVLAAEPAPEALRLSVDRPIDLAVAQSVINEFEGEDPLEISYSRILDLFRKKPSIFSENSSQINNEGYYLSLTQVPPVQPKNKNFKKSWELVDRAREVIPTGTQTFSKNSTQFVRDGAPAFIERGDGSHIWDVDGNEYIDFSLGLGPVILGYGAPSVIHAVQEQLTKGVIFPQPSTLELELANLVKEIVPCAEMVRFGKNGSDATSGAVRVARAFTGRDLIACCGYHGWQDWYIGTTTRRLGVPKAVQDLSLTFNYNDIESLERLFAENPGKIAAVVLEPVSTVAPKDQFLEKVRKLATEHGAVLIFDEVVTGARFAPGGAQEFFGVIPDLAAFGKAIGNGFPIAFIAGRKDIMAYFSEIFFSFTNGGELLSMAAAIATLKEIKKPETLRGLWTKGKRLQDGINVLAKHYGLSSFLQCDGYPVRTILTIQDQPTATALEIKSYLQQESMARQVFFTGAHNLCAAHSDQDIDQTLLVYRTVLELLSLRMKEGNLRQHLKGPPMQAVFRKI